MLVPIFLGMSSFDLTFRAPSAVCLPILRELGIERDDRSRLATALGMEPRRGDDFVRDGDLRGHVRLKYIFESDRATHQALKHLSDGMEHGYLDFAQARAAAAASFARAAADIRRSILGEVELDHEIIGTPRDLGVNAEPPERDAVQAVPAPGRRWVPDSGAEARVKRPKFLQPPAFPGAAPTAAAA